MPLRVALFQWNFTVGDLEGNARRILEGIRQARAAGADLALFPELAVTGYPPEDLVHHAPFVRKSRETAERIAREVRGLIAVFGFVDRPGRPFNAAAVCAQGRIADVYHKIRLPNYGVFDELRTFTPGTRAPVYLVGNARIAAGICEDIWFPDDPLRSQVREQRAAAVFNISSSPYHALKPRERLRMLQDRATRYGVFVLYCNLVGGQDELVFDGTSAVIAPDGELLARADSFREEVLVADVDLEHAAPRGEIPPGETLGLTTELVPLPAADPGPRTPIRPRIAPALEEDEEIFRALVLGTRDYFLKNGFRRAVLGLSGGIDSSVVACLAVEALGNENVIGVSMPSRFSTDHSRSDAARLAQALGIRFLTLPIEPIFTAALETLRPVFGDRPFDVAEENLQARIRGLLLMAISNKFGYLVLATGNKSELSMGYSTLYGDMAGGFSVIKDVYKTRVYALGRYINRRAGRGLIPEHVFEKPPSAELRPDQTDQDSLPPYPLLDRILEMYVERDLEPDRIARETRADSALVREVIRRVDRNEYKRRQGPPGIKITPRLFGKDRRYPITCRYRL